MIHVGVTLCLTLFSGCQDSAVEEGGGTTVVYQAGDNKAIDLDKHSAPIPAGKTTLKRDSRMGNSAINDGSRGVDLVLVVDNSNSMVTYGTDRSVTRSRSSGEYYNRRYYTYKVTLPGYFSALTSAHRLNEAFDVFAKQIKEENIDLNVTLVTAASDVGYRRDYQSLSNKNDPGFFTREKKAVVSSMDLPRTCIPAMNRHLDNNPVEDYSVNTHTQGVVFRQRFSYVPSNFYGIDRPAYDQPNNLYTRDLVGIGSNGYYISKFGEDNRNRYYHINCIVEPFASLGILADLINPDKGLQSGVVFNRQKVFRNNNTLKIFVVISDSFSPGPDDIAEPTRTVLRKIVKENLLEDTETKFTEKANKAFGQNNVRFYSFSTRGNVTAGKFTKDIRPIERVRQTHPDPNNRDRTNGIIGGIGREPTRYGRYFGRSYTRLAKYYGGERFDLNSQWTPSFESMFNFQQDTSEAVDTNSYDLALVKEGQALEVTEVRVGERTIEASDYTIDKTTTPHKIVFNSGVLDSTKTEQIFIDVTVTGK
ncbi:MAG: hypothetical protein OXC40_02620 [Proteobacteria bacterium]|nr:hypothetical protein [Pseudomonadota bacterium]